ENAVGAQRQQAMRTSEDKGLSREGPQRGCPLAETRAHDRLLREPRRKRCRDLAREALSCLSMEYKREHEERQLDGHRGLPLRAVCQCRLPQQHGAKAGIEEVPFFDRAGAPECHFASPPV